MGIKIPVSPRRVAQRERRQQIEKLKRSSSLTLDDIKSLIILLYEELQDLGERIKSQ